MNRNIDDTIKEITLSLIQFDDDIIDGNTEGINKFLDIIPTYETFFRLKVPDKYDEKMHYSKFRNEIRDVFTSLFNNGGDISNKGSIYEVAEPLFIKLGKIKMQGNVPVIYSTSLTQEIDQKLFEITMKLGFHVCEYDGTIPDIENFRWEKNPLYNLSDEEYLERLEKKEYGIRYFKEFDSNPFKEFVAKYRGLYDNEITGSKPIIDIEYISLIYKKYETYFTEDKDTWINRFIYPNDNPVNKIDVEEKAFNDSNKLVLLGILASIQGTTRNKFDYDKFVSDRFGLLNFQKAKTDHKDKQTFKDVLKDCNTILKK